MVNSVVTLLDYIGFVDVQYTCQDAAFSTFALLQSHFLQRISTMVSDSSFVSRIPNPQHGEQPVGQASSLTLLAYNVHGVKTSNQQ